MSAWLIEKLRFEPLNKQLEYPQDFIAIPYAGLCWAMVYFSLHHFILRNIGEERFPVNKNDGKYLLERQKFYTASWKFVNFTLCGALGSYLAFTESWVFSPPDYFKGWPDHGMSPIMKLYYQMELSSYAFALIVMPFEPKQSLVDYAALIVHHSSTIFLIWTSYIYGFHRVGIVVAFLHDLADPFMEIAKVNLYIGRHKVFLIDAVSRYIIYHFCYHFSDNKKHFVSVLRVRSYSKKC
jgi:hypothetical protein